MTSLRASTPRRRRQRGATVLGAAIVASISFASSATAQDPSALVATEVVINPSGGVQTNGSDGLRMQVGVDQAGFATFDTPLARNNTQWCCGSFPSGYGGGPLLSIGTSSVGNGSFGGDAPWDSIQVLSTSGTGTTSGGSGTGSGSATVRYDYTLGGRLYRVDRVIGYTFPNDYYSDTYNVTIPSGNTLPVKLYYGGDTAPGGSDQGYGIMLTSPRRSIISLNTTSHVMFGFREIAGSIPFAGARSEALGSFGTSAGTANNGGDIGFNAQASNHDASLAVQWDLGSTPGTFSAGMETFVTPQGVTLTGGFRDGAGDPGVEEMLDLSIVNSDLSNATGVGFAVQLPAGVTVGSSASSNTCGGTMTAAAGTGSVVLSGAAVNLTSNCVITVPVSAGSGTYTLNAASVTSTTGLDNGFGTTSLVVSGTPSAPPSSPTSGLLGLAPARLLDTRATDTALDAQEARVITVAGQGGVPADATAVVVNATITDAMSSGYLTLFPCGTTAPATSTLNFPAVRPTSNAATVGLGDGGKLCARSTAVAHLVLDVTAAHSPTQGSGRIATFAPARLEDTRSGARLAAGTVHEVVVAGRNGVPSDATSAALNLTIIDPAGAGYATVYGCGAATPTASNVNFGAGQTVANAAVVRLGTDGKVCIVSSADAHVLVDATAAFSPTGSGGTFVSLAPTRLADSRPSDVVGGTSYEVLVAGQGGVPSSSTAVALNVTIDDPSSTGYATVYPCGATVPMASNLNFIAGQTVANGVTVGIGTGGKVCVFTTADAGVIVDVDGYYQAPA